MKTITLSQGKHAIVDDDDYENISQHKWYLKKHHGNFYAIRKLKLTGKNISMHREIMVAIIGQIIDHKDGNGLNNQKSNLRFATNSENNVNRKCTNPTGYIGVRKNRKRFDANIHKNNKRIYIGIFDTPEQAARAYDKKATELFGEFANLNFK